MFKLLEKNFFTGCSLCWVEQEINFRHTKHPTPTPNKKSCINTVVCGIIYLMPASLGGYYVLQPDETMKGVGGGVEFFFALFQQLLHSVL